MVAIHRVRFLVMLCSPTTKNMQFDEYQHRLEAIQKQYPVTPDMQRKAALALGLAEECGEVMSLLKRLYRGDTPADFQSRLVKELGDTLAYLVLVGDSFGISLEEIAAVNLKKLEARFDNNTLSGEGDDR